MGSADRVVFFGLVGDPFSEIALTHLRSEFAHVQAFTGTTEVPPRAAGPGRLDADWLFCFKSKTIFGADTLNSLRKGAINFHTASPRYPGSGGVNWVLYNGDVSSAITVHRITPAVDAGQIIEVSEFSCVGVDTVAALLELTYHMHLLTFLRVTSRIAFGGEAWLADAAAGYCGQAWADRTYRLRDLEALKHIDPSMPLEEVNRRIRATRYKHHGPYLEVAGHRFTLDQ